jgi:hypothetical protein
MESAKLFRYCLVVLFVATISLNSYAEDNKKNGLESLLGKYEGHMMIYWQLRPLDYDYQTEIVSVDKAAKTLSLTAYCRKCEVNEWKRENCKITEIAENISFICKGRYSDEKYTYKEGKLTATGVGKKHPFTINATKVDK